MHTDSVASTLAHAAQLKEFDVLGSTLAPLPDGSLRQGVERMVVRNIRLPLPMGVVTAPKTTLSEVVVRMKLGASARSFDVLGAAAAEVRIEGAAVLPSGEALGRGAGDAPWTLAPVAAMEGVLHGCIRDAVWVVDAQVTAPISRGHLDFNRVVVEHVGPNSSMGLSRNGLYVDAPDRARTDLFVFTTPDVPGASYEQRAAGGFRVTDRGGLDIPALVAGVLGTGLRTPLGHMAGNDADRMLERTKLAGQLQLGDGAIGHASDELVLDGRAQGKNCLSVSAAVLGQRLVLRWPELSASRARLRLPGGTATAGAVHGALETHVTGLSRHAREGAGLGVAVLIHAMSLCDLAFGSVEPEAATLPS
ncbi:MAG TPA: hypothetical protein VJ743_22235 [Albitalea sp.]|nr:hypothetical protein [Albitalea sp.]